MFLRFSGSNFYDIALVNAFKVYKADILSTTKKMWKEEALEGESCKQSTIMQYYAAIYLAAILHNIYINGTTSWDEILTKYKVAKKKKELACHGIDLDKIFEAFTLPPVTDCGIEGMGLEESFEIEPSTNPCNNSVQGNCSGGIEAMGIEDSFEIEPEEEHEVCFEPTTIDVAALLANPCGCEVFIDNICEC